MAYTLTVSEEIYSELVKHLDMSKNNDIRDLLAAYIRLSHEFNTFKKDVEDITNKLSRF